MSLSTVRVLVLNEPEAANGVNWWRMYRPMGLLTQQYRDLDIRWNRGQILPSDLLWPDVVIAFRPCNESQVAVLLAAKNAGAKIIVDYDDDLMNIPVEHGAYPGLGGAAPHVRAALALADVVWVSTANLGKVTAHHNWRLVPNAVLPSDVADEPAHMTKTVVWRGGIMGFYDLWARQEEYLHLLHHCERFVWMGYKPPYTTPPAQRSKAQFHRWENSVQGYLANLRAVAPNVVWKPLADVPFNDSKSNIAWIEATCVGAVCCTDVWRVAQQSEWSHCISEKIVWREDSMRVFWERSREAVLNSYDLNWANQVRYQSIVSDTVTV